MTDAAGKNFIDLTASIVSAYLSNNPTPASEIPTLISQIHAALLRVSGGRIETPLEPAKPAVSVKKSMTPDYLVCLEDGKRFKSLKRHLRTQYNMTPEQYRDKWGLPADYPMVAPNYAVARSQLAKKMGLGQQQRRRNARNISEIFAKRRRGDLAGEPTVRRPRQAPRARRSECARPWRAGRWSAAASDARESRIRRTPRAHRWPGSACGVRPEYSVSRIAISPRTICASLSPRYFSTRLAGVAAVDLLGEPDLADAALHLVGRRNARPPASDRACGRVR